MLSAAGAGRCRAGFTLIELLVVLLLAAVLAALAYPSYVQQVRQARRADAVAAVALVQQAQERWRGRHAAYAPHFAADGGLGLSDSPGLLVSGDGHYRLRLTHADALGYALDVEAVGPQADDRACRHLRLVLHRGHERRHSGPTPDHGHPDGANRRCWRQGRGRSGLPGRPSRPALRARPRRASAGISLVALLVGLALGLFALAVAIRWTMGLLAAHRQLVLEARLSQELRAAMALSLGHLRRAGHWAGAAGSLPATGAASPAPGVPANPNALLQAPPHRAGEPVDWLHFSHDRAPEAGLPGESARQSGLRLHDGQWQLRLGDSGWQTLTDARQMRVTRLAMTLRQHDLPLPDLACPAPCAAPATVCQPVVRVRDVLVQATARALADPTLERSLEGRVRVRADLLEAGCS